MIKTASLTKQTWDSWNYDIVLNSNILKRIGVHKYFCTIVYNKVKMSSKDMKPEPVFLSPVEKRTAKGIISYIDFARKRYGNDCIVSVTYLDPSGKEILFGTYKRNEFRVVSSKVKPFQPGKESVYERLLKHGFELFENEEPGKSVYLSKVESRKYIAVDVDFKNVEVWTMDEGTDEDFIKLFEDINSDKYLIYHENHARSRPDLLVRVLGFDMK